MDCCDKNGKKGEELTVENNISDNIIYTCPMHPEIRKNDPGMCPECGMNLVKASGSSKDFDKHKGHSTDAFLKKFWIALTLTIPLVIYSELTEIFFSWSAPIFPGYEYVMLLLGSIVFFYGGWVFLSGAWAEIKGRLPGMMTLIAIAISAAYAWSVYATFTPDTTLFWELATLVTIMLLGHWLEMRAVKGARGALRELANLLPQKADIIRNGENISITIEEIQEGDVAIVKPGGKIPADGVVSEGMSDVNESIVTGESKPVSKKEGDEVIAGTINGDGQLKVGVEKVGKETFLAGVMKLVEEAQASKSRLQVLSDKAALVLTTIAVSGGAITLLIWLLIGDDTSFAVARLVAVLVIACPHALGLAVPLVASISTNMAAANGFIIKERMSLESARSIDIVLFDKTGTLTKGEFGIDLVIPSPEFTEEEVLSLSASVNSASEHSIGSAIVEDSKNRGIDVPEVSDFKRIPGKGASGIVLGKAVVIGSEELVFDNNFSISEEVKKKIAEENSKGRTVVHLMVDNKYAGAISLSDIVREESKEAVEMLHKEGLKVAMITGDSEDVAKTVSRDLGIDEYFSRVLPDKKIEKVKKLQKKGLRVAMVGDGVNDAPALAQADLGIAIGAGTNVAIESAGIILVRDDPRDIGKIIKLSKLTWRKMIQNLFWATGYNVVALPLAAGALFAWGIVIDPAVGAIFMSASTVIVAFNAVLMRRSSL